MESFKVICKNSKGWCKRNTKIVNAGGILGLFGKKKVVSNTKNVDGPSKDEICIVVRINKDGYYSLAGYVKCGWYPPQYFVRLDDFVETQKEIVRKTQPCFN